MKHEIQFEPGHDCIRFECFRGNADCAPGQGGSRSHSVRGVNIRWLVIGDKGAIQFLLCTGWLPEPELSLDTNRTSFVFPANIGYHAREPQYDGEKVGDENCDVLNDPCYYNVSSLNAEEPFRVLCNEGGDALWDYLEAVYSHIFESGKYPDPKPYKIARRNP